MNLPWRIWAVFLSGFSILIAGFGAHASTYGNWWPVAGVWLCAVFASYGLSVWAAFCLVFVGLFMDLMTDAPLGAWPLAFLLAYFVGVIAWTRHPLINGIVVEAVALFGGMLVISMVLGLAAGLAGYAGYDGGGLMTEYVSTALLYPVVRYLLLPSEVRESKR